MDIASIASTRPAGATPFNPAALRNAEPAEQRKAVAAQFEAVLVRQLLGKTMNSMLGGEGGGVAGSVFGDMMAETMANQLTSGPGLGLGRMLERQLAPRAPAVPATEVQSKTDASS